MTWTLTYKNIQIRIFLSPEVLTLFLSFSKSYKIDLIHSSYWFAHVIIVCKNSLYKLFLSSPKKMPFKIFGFSIFNIKKGCILTLVSSYRVAASFITSKFSEHRKSGIWKKLCVAKMPDHAYNSNNNNDTNNNNNNNNNKYWVDAQRRIVSSHGDRDPLSPCLAILLEMVSQ